MLYDTHFHLELDKTPRETLRLIEAEHIYTIAVTNLPGTFSRTEQLCIDSRYVRPALGYHPELVARYPGQLGLFSELMGKTRYVGEVGLDNARKSPADYQQQKTVFEKLIGLCAAAGDKILTVHTRRAERDVMDIIGEGFPGKVILHWFSGSVKQMELAAQRGFYFSVNLPMTASENGRKLISAFPSERLLMETDGPFTMVGDTTCTPLVTAKIAGKLRVLRPDVDLSANLKTLLAI